MTDSTTLSIQENPNWVLKYWQSIEYGAVTVSAKVKRVYEKLADRIITPQGRFAFDCKKADHAVEFIENYCKHSKGKYGGKPFILELWQKAFVSAIFGFVDKDTGFRQFTEAILIVGRKNGKSTLAAAIGLYLFVADGESGAEIYSAATKKDQAKIIWMEAKRMIKKSPALRKRIKTLVAEFVYEKCESIFRPLGNDSDTLDGLNVHGGLIDELHAIKDKNIYDVIVDGTSAREQPLILITSTAGTVRECIYDEKYEYASSVINDVEGFEDERLLAVIYELDNREEWTDPECWQKANPALGTIKNYKTLAEKVEKAKRDSAQIRNLLCKDFNIRETSSAAWLNYNEFENKAMFDVSVLRPKYGIGGTDLSKCNDLTAAKVIFQVPNDANIYVLQMYWLPEGLLEQRVNEDKIPYDKWAQAGYLRLTPDNTVHPKYVTEWFIEIQEIYDINILWVGYDGWSAKYWVDDMKGYFGEQAMEPVIQGKKTLSAPMYALAADFRSQRIIYNNHPIDKWCLANTNIDMDRNGNIQPTKGKSRRRIDGTAALLDAYVVLQNHLQDYQNSI